MALPQLLDAYERKYRQEEVGHVVRSLVYFADADAEPLPEGLTPAHWAEMKRYLQQQVLALPA